MFNVQRLRLLPVSASGIRVQALHVKKSSDKVCPCRLIVISCLKRWRSRLSAMPTSFTRSHRLTARKTLSRQPTPFASSAKRVSPASWSGRHALSSIPPRIVVDVEACQHVPGGQLLLVAAKQIEGSLHVLFKCELGCRTSVAILDVVIDFEDVRDGDA